MPANDHQHKQRKGQFRGRQLQPQAVREIKTLLANAPRRRDLLLEYLHLIQDHYRFISRAHLHVLAVELGLSQAEAYEVASFYHHFDLEGQVDEPAAGITVRVCDSLSCEMAGAEALIRSLGQHLGEGIRVLRAPCLGQCQAAPAVLVDGYPLEKATLQNVLAHIDEGPLQAPMPKDYIGFLAYSGAGGYELLKSCHRGMYSAEQVIARLEESGLRGLGGAGFSAGRKWRIVREQAGEPVVVVNIDEGEPGTFKDRFFLQRDPHRMLEGALIAAWAIGAPEIYLYLRDEYPSIRLMLQREIRELDHLACPLPAIELRRGAGSYVCGEESAMLESIEGRRGMPRLRPPYIATMGLFGRPTLAHNMETLYWLRDIVEKGSEWLTRQGRHGRTGMRSYSVSGRVSKPGVYRAPAGITLRELLDEYCGGMQSGHTLYGYFPGGASGGMLPSSLDDIPLDFDTLQDYGCFIGSAAIIVFSTADSAKNLALNAMRFFASESCGQCTPCRVGTARAADLMQQPNWDCEQLTELASVMMDASICGLGQAAPNSLLCAMQYFPAEFE